MVNILIPTDYSENAALALEFGIRIADKLNGNILLLHVYKRPDLIIGKLHSPTKEYSQLLHESQEILLKKHISEAIERSAIKGINGVNITPVLKEGDIVYHIDNIIRENNIYFTILGTQGNNMLESFILGSVSTKILHNSKIPFILIPPKINVYEDLDRLSFATDYSDTSYLGMRFLLETNKLYNYQLSSFHINNKKIDEEKKWLTSFEDKVLFHKTIIREEFISGVQDLVDRCRINLIALVIPKETNIFSPFMKNKAQRISMKKTIPVLGIPQYFLENINKFKGSGYFPKR